MASAPAIEQVRMVGGEVWLEVSEAVSTAALAKAVASGELTLAAAGGLITLTASQPITDGDEARRRIVLRLAPAPAPGTELSLTIPPAALEDDFRNHPPSSFTQLFAWTATNTMIWDGAPPRIESIRVEQSYDAADRLTQYRDALGNVTTYSYDALGRRTATVYPDSTTETASYNPAGNPIEIRDPRGSVLTQSYDAAGRLTARDIDPGAGVVGPTHETYTPDGLGRIVFAQSGPGLASLVTTERAYDSLSRMISETTNGRTLTSSYDPIGARTGIVYPSGASFEATVDALGRLSSLTQLFSSPSSSESRAGFTYQGFRRATTSLGGTLRATSLYDSAQRLTEKNWAGGPEAQAEALTWTPKNLLATITRTPNSLGNSSFAHDGAGRLTLARRTLPPVPPTTTGTELRRDAYTYDAAENLLGHTEQTSCDLLPETKTFPLDASGRNRPAAAGAESLAWDPSGNLIGKGDQRFLYDYRNRLAVVTDLGGAEIARYAYDVFNRRVKKQVGLDATETVWDGWEPIEEYKNNQLTSRRLFGPNLGELLRLENDLDGNGTLEQTYLPVFDVLGNLTELRREDGSIVERYDYSPFGERRVIANGADSCDWTEVSAAGNAFGFHGLGRDEETGLLYARNRYYDPEMGRFVTADPLGYVDGPNGYQYGMNSPGTYSDPLGLRRKEIEPDSKEGRKIQEEYNLYYQLLKATPTGKEIAHRVENDPTFELTILYDPEYRAGLILENYKYGEDGSTISATLRVGRLFPSAPSVERDYPFGFGLTKRAEIAVCTVGHEEGGHFLNSIAIPEYNRLKLEAEKASRFVAEARCATEVGLRLSVVNTGENERVQRRALSSIRVEVERSLAEMPWIAEQHQFVVEAGVCIENTADAVGEAVVQEFRKLPEALVREVVDAYRSGEKRE